MEASWVTVGQSLSRLSLPHRAVVGRLNGDGENVVGHCGSSSGDKSGVQPNKYMEKPHLGSSS